MKFSLADPADGYTIQAYDSGEILIGEQRFTRSIVLLPDRIISTWKPQTLAQLTLAEFRTILDTNPDLVLLGTGEIQRFPDMEIYQAASEVQMGLEVMTTAAACRTYNVIASEGRRAAAVLLLDSAPDTDS